MHKDLPIDILSAVEKPARYTGMEFGSIVKPESEVEVSFALAFPDTYEIGMSYLGFKILMPFSINSPISKLNGSLRPGWIWKTRCESAGLLWKALKRAAVLVILIL